jgi:hypothetical protein
MLIQRLRMDRYVKQELLKFRSRREVEIANKGQALPFSALVKYWWDDGMMITERIFPYVVLGVGIGALIHGFVPASLAEQYLAVRAWWTIPLAVLLGAPLYANSVSVIPVMEALVGKGVPIGTALAFMTSIVSISIPEGLILKKVMRWQLLAMFFTITVSGIVIMGYLMNWLL